MTSPIVIFAYRRPAHLKRTLNSLMKCNGFADSPVIVYCDGPKNLKEKKATDEVRQVVNSLLGTKAEYHYKDINIGLSQSIILGVSEVLRRYGKAIVVEDDLRLAPDFLSYMNQALERYALEEKIFQISAYMFNVRELSARSEGLFLPLTVSWGWATWQRAWNNFDLQAKGWDQLQVDHELRRRFNLDGNYNYAQMLENQMSNRIDSWAIRWYWSVFRAGGLVLFPPRSLVENIGMDGSGTHGRGILSHYKSKDVWPGKIHMPLSIELDADAFRWVKKSIWYQNGGWLQFVKAQFRNFLYDLKIEHRD